LRSLERLLPRLSANLMQEVQADALDWEMFSDRLYRHFPNLFRLYYSIYGSRYDFFFHLEDLITGLGRAWFQRPADLRDLYQAREGVPLWFQSNHWSFLSTDRYCMIRIFLL